MSELVIRPAVKPDIELITNSWIKTFKGSPAVAGMIPAAYYRGQHEVMEKLIPRSDVFVLCSAEDEGNICAWICAEPLVSTLLVHMIYVKKRFRRMGLADMLLKFMLKRYQLELVTYTHKTPVFWRRSREASSGEPFFAKVKERGYMYDPFLIHVDEVEDGI